MAVYVDSAKYKKLNGRKSYAHMTADSLEELHSFAQQVGVKAHFFHRGTNHPHYDISGEQQVKAVDAGALEVSSKELIVIAKKLLESKMRFKDYVIEAQKLTESMIDVWLISPEDDGNGLELSQVEVFTDEKSAAKFLISQAEDGFDDLFDDVKQGNALKAEFNKLVRLKDVKSFIDKYELWRETPEFKILKKKANRK